MLIKITIEGGLVQEVETSEPALVQVYDLDEKKQGQRLISLFETPAQEVIFEPAEEGDEGEEEA
jgi:hypothetical protein